MRLIHIATRTIKEFNQREIPPYAILSHTWGKEEVSFQDFQSGQGTTLKGYQKIIGCCEQAEKDGLEYVWVDTCCIDKTSSAELSEAINSMFTWYGNAEICYAYLEDVDCGPKLNERLTFALFKKSRWFTRGWTLQELIAPTELDFFGQSWDLLGSRTELYKITSQITGIGEDVFRWRRALSNYSVAQRLSWAANRCTTRVEDEAYCLMGLFGVSMPLLYGEGMRAFVRLQEEIMKRSDDQSIFAWELSGHMGRGLLAPSVSCFRNSGHIMRADDGNMAPFFLTNKGIQITLPIIEPDNESSIPFVPCSGAMYSGGGGVGLTLTPADYIAILSCKYRSGPIVGERIGIELNRDEPGKPYYRNKATFGLLPLRESDIPKSHQTIIIESSDLREVEQLPKDESLFILRIPVAVMKGYRCRFSSGPWSTSADGFMSVRLQRRFKHQASVAFSDDQENDDGFVVSLRGDRRWELVTNANLEDEKRVTDSLVEGCVETLQSKPYWTKRQKRHNRPPVEVSLRARQRPHAVIISVAVGEVPAAPNLRTSISSAIRLAEKLARNNEALTSSESVNPNPSASEIEQAA